MANSVDKSGQKNQAILLWIQLGEQAELQATGEQDRKLILAK